jgi:hypothetical protein
VDGVGQIQLLQQGELHRRFLRPGAYNRVEERARGKIRVQPTPDYRRYRAQDEEPRRRIRDIDRRVFVVTTYNKIRVETEAAGSARDS